MTEPRREDIINTMKQYLRISLKFDAVEDITGAEITEASMTETASAIAALSSRPKLNAGQLVQRIMRVLDHDLSTLTAAKLAEQIAAGILDLPADYWQRPAPVAEGPKAIDHWQFFNYDDNILIEAKARLVQAQSHPTKWSANNKENTLEYWCAWVAHANAAASLPVRPLVKEGAIGLTLNEFNVGANQIHCELGTTITAANRAFGMAIEAVNESRAAPQPTDGGKS